MGGRRALSQNNLQLFTERKRPRGACHEGRSHAAHDLGIQELWTNSQQRSTNSTPNGTIPSCRAGEQNLSSYSSEFP